jgi:hypothetical protein
MYVNEENKKENQLIIFEQIFFNFSRCRYTRRKVAEALRRVRDWFNRSYRQDNLIPMEFKDLGGGTLQQHQQEQERRLWKIKFHI